MITVKEWWVAREDIRSSLEFFQKFIMPPTVPVPVLAKELEGLKHELRRRGGWVKFSFISWMSRRSGSSYKTLLFKMPFFSGLLCPLIFQEMQFIDMEMGIELEPLPFLHWLAWFPVLEGADLWFFVLAFCLRLWGWVLLLGCWLICLLKLYFLMLDNMLWVLILCGGDKILQFFVTVVLIWHLFLFVSIPLQLLQGLPPVKLPLLGFPLFLLATFQYPLAPTPYIYWYYLYPFHFCHCLLGAFIPPLLHLLSFR